MKGPTGIDLIAELRAAAFAKGITLNRLIAPLVVSSATNLIGSLTRSDHPNPLTVERVRACIAGTPIPARAPPNKGRRGFKRHEVRDSETRVSSTEVERRRRLAEFAHANRRPGETLAAAQRRMMEGAQQ